MEQGEQMTDEFKPKPAGFTSLREALAAIVAAERAKVPPPATRDPPRWPLLRLPATSAK